MAANSAAAALRARKAMADLRDIFKNFRQWPTASRPDSEYVGFVREQFVAGHASNDKEVIKAVRQQAKDYATMLKNLDRQKDIALVLSGERAPQRQLVKLAAARCGLSVPDIAPVEGLTLEEAKGSALRQPWRPDTQSEITQKYSKRVDKRLGGVDSSNKFSKK